MSKAAAQATQKWKYIGAETMRDNKLYSQLGEVVDAPAEDILSPGGIPAIPAEDFDALFTPEECAAYPYFGMRANAPETFHAKMQRAAIRLAELRSN